jgi:hypothetical protein
LKSHLLNSTEKQSPPKKQSKKKTKRKKIQKRQRNRQKGKDIVRLLEEHQDVSPQMTGAPLDRVVG